MSLNKSDLIDRFWKARYQKDGYHAKSGFLNGSVRDRVERKDGGEVVYLLWGNQIASIKDGVLKLSDCGWKTSTTKARLCAILGRGNIDLYISQESGIWYLTDWNTDQRKRYVWGEGVTIPLDAPLSKLTPYDQSKLAAEAKKLNEPIRRFVKEFKGRIDNGELSTDGGECWNISMGLEKCEDCNNFCKASCGGGIRMLVQAVRGGGRTDYYAAMLMADDKGLPSLEKIRENWKDIAHQLRKWLKKTAMLRRSNQLKRVAA